jgi:hypothetical protein
MIKKSIAVLSVVMLLASCVKWPLWPGKHEYIYVDYTKTGNVGSIINYFSSKFVSIDTAYVVSTADTSKIVIDGIRINSKWKNFSLVSDEQKKIKIEERTDETPKWREQSEFSNVSTIGRSKVACVLVLDMSTSVKDNIEQIKEYAKTFIDVIVQTSSDSKIAVVFFSGKQNIVETDFYGSTTINTLKSLINNFNDLHDRTALYDATIKGISKLKNLSFNGAKSLVVFSDGGDNDSDFPTQKIEQIQNDEINKTIIALKGSDYDRIAKNSSKSLVKEKSDFIVAKNIDDLDKVFKHVASQLTSVYRLVYNKSQQSTPYTEIRINIPIEKN